MTKRSVPPHVTTRRTFLGTVIATSAIAATPDSGWASPWCRSFTGESGIKATLTVDDLHALAARAMDVAASARVSYGDIRLGLCKMQSIGNSASPRGSINRTMGFGIRILIGGAWGYGFSAVLTEAAVLSATQEAIARARGAAPYAGESVILASVPVGRGTWETSYELDPFLVSPDDQLAYCQSIEGLAARFPGTLVSFRQQWFRERRVFASTEGASLTQTLHYSHNELRITAKDWLDAPVHQVHPMIYAMNGGYEQVLRPQLQEDVYQRIEELRRLLQYHPTQVDVGRYPAVFDGRSFGGVLQKTLGRALELDRALGEQANEAGTSFLLPDERTLGVRRFSPHLNLTVDREPDSWGYSRWDDEGVEARSFDVVRDGTVVDFFTTRTNAGDLASWHTGRGVQTGPQGVSIAPAIDREPRATVPALSMSPGASVRTLDAMVRDLGDGILVMGMSPYELHTDFQLSGGMFASHNAMMFEVKRGVITKRVRGAVVQFGTERLLNAIVAVGDVSTQQRSLPWVGRGNPVAQARQSITAPAVLVSELDITRPPAYKTTADRRSFEQSDN